MNRSKKLSVNKLYGKRKFITALTAIFGVIVAVIILLTYYGQNVGSFTVKLEDELYQRNIYISTDKDFETNKTARLEADSLKDAEKTTLTRINQTICKNTVGTCVGNKSSYLSYTFYLKNEGTETLDITETLKITKVKDNLDECSWVWYFEEDMLDENVVKEDEGTVYRKKDTNGPVNLNLDQDYPDQTEFINQDTVFNKDVKGVKPGEVKKITVITWIDANDKDAQNFKGNGAIRYTLTFSLYKEDDNR